MGYPECTKGYKLFDPRKGRCVRSRIFLFHEDKFYYADSEDVRNIISSEDEDDIESIIEHPIGHKSLPEIPEGIVSVGENPVMATYEETFMEQVRNIGEKGERKHPKRLIEEITNYAEHSCIAEGLTSEYDEPKSRKEALNGKHSDQWKEAMDSEYSSLLKSETLELVPPPEGKNIVGSRWILKVKHNTR